MLFVPLSFADPIDEVCGVWSRDQLEEMDRRFVAAMELAFAKGLEIAGCRKRPARIVRSGGLLPPSPPAEKARSPSIICGAEDAASANHLPR
jgi:hypothetical protein